MSKEFAEANYKRKKKEEEKKASSSSNYVNQNQSGNQWDTRKISNDKSMQRKNEAQNRSQTNFNNNKDKYINDQRKTGTVQSRTVNNTVQERQQQSYGNQKNEHRFYANDKSMRQIYAAKGTTREEEEKKNSSIAKNTFKVSVESLKQTAYDDAITATDIGKENKWRQRSVDVNAADEQVQPLKQDVERAEKAQKQYEELLKKRDESERKIQEITKDATGLEKAIYGAAESGTGMLTDIAFGPASLAHMGVRSYGAQRGKAQAEGATEAEDRWNALFQAGKEVGTEMMFRGAGLAKKVAGGKGLSIGDKMADILTRNMAGRKGDILGGAIRYGGAIGEENLEEVAGWGLDPLISELTYKRNVRMRQAQDMLQQESDALRSNITDENTARAVSSYLSSDDFIEKNKQAYMDTGVGEKQAQAMAEKMRDYLTASLTGDTMAMADLQDEISIIASKKSLQWDWNELKDTIAATTLLTGVTGLPGAVSTTARGVRIKDALGSEGLNALANTAIDFEDADMSVKAQAVRDRLAAGKDVTATQVNDLAVGLERQERKDQEREKTYIQTAENKMKQNNLVSPFTVDQDGAVYLGTVTGEAYDQETKAARDLLKAASDIRQNEEGMSLTDTDIDNGAKAIAAFKTGVFTVDDANQLNFSNQTVRTAFQKATGIDLNQYIVKGRDGSVDIPKTNTATKNALFTMAADNLSRSAEAETKNWMDQEKGRVVKEVSSRMGKEGAMALQESLDGVDERDRSNYLMTANAVDFMYQAGRNTGRDWKDVQDTLTQSFPGIKPEALQKMYEAGLRDRDAALDTARGLQTKIGEAINTASGEKVEPRGNLLIETKEEPKGSTVRLFSEVARSLGVDIHLTDNLPIDKKGKRQANGQYKDGEIWLNVNSSFEKNVGYIFMHEITHHMKLYAPEQYQKLEKLVREKWFAKDPEEMQDRIRAKMEVYQKAKQNLTEEQALEEIIADAAHEFLRDRNFAKQVCDTDLSLGRAIISSIQSAIRGLFRIFGAGGIQETHMDSLFSELDILEEAERLWLEAYKQAAANKAAVGLVEWNQDERKSLNLGFAREVDAWYNNSTEFNKPGGYFVVGRTSDALKSIGIKDYDITWDKSKIKKILENHKEISIDTIKQVPKAIENPVLVAQSKTRLNSIILYGEVYATDGDPVRIAIQLNPKSKQGRILNFAKIASAYGDNNVQSIIDTSDILYVDPNKKRTDNWLSATRLQLPLGLTQYGSINNVTYYQDDVKQNDAMAQAFAKALEQKEKRTRNSITDEELARIKAKKRTNKQDRQILRDAGEKLKEDDFYSLYHAHKLDLRRRGNVEEQVESIKKDGFYGDAGFGVNVVSSSINNIYRFTLDERREYLREFGLSEEDIEESIQKIKDHPEPGRLSGDVYFPRVNLVAMAYGGREGETVLLVPDHHVYKGDSVINGFKPFDYEVVKVERDFQPYYELYSKAYDEYKTAKEDLKESGVEQLPDDTTARYSLTSWEKTNKKKKLNDLIKAGHSEKEAKKWIDDLNSIASIILDDPERLDYLADPDYKFLKDNGDYYKKTLDASTLCDKRRYYQGTYDAIMHRLKDAALDDQDVVRIRTLLKEHGYTSPCGICYVESQRKNLGRYAKEWYDGYARKNEIHLDDVTTSDGLDKLKKTNPQVANDFVKAMNAKGVQSPKVVKLRTDYREDIMKMRPETVKYLNKIGGLRFHSFSDFETVHTIDTMQAVMDMATKNLMGMAYAKVPAFAAIFGPTGIKINLSLIMKTDENGNAVYDEDGKLVFDPVEGIDYEEAKQWRDKYPDNVAFIVVGKDIKTTIDALNDDRIDYVIPFHKSKWSDADLKRLGLNGYVDFATGHQDNKVFVSEYWNYNKTGKENAKEYLRRCKKKGVKPVFEQLLVDNGDGSYSLPEDGSMDNYWKLLIEGKMYNHLTRKGAKQKPVKPNFNMEEARRLLNAYEGGADTLPVAKDVVNEFVEEYESKHSSNNANTDNDRVTKLNQALDEKQLRFSVTPEQDEEYMNAVEAGDMETAQHMVDEAAQAAGYTTKAYHGTGSNFTVFDPGLSGKNYSGYSKYGKGIYFSSDEEIANKWGNNRKVVPAYLKLENPYVIENLPINKGPLLDEYNRLRKAQNSRLKPAKQEFSGYLIEMLNGMTNDKGYSTEFLKSLGYDGIVSEKKWDLTDWTETVVFDPEQIKSAKPVTYDDNGNVIPLSERFNETNPDIRYSIAPVDTEGVELSEGQRSFFMESKAVDEMGRLIPVYHVTRSGGFVVFDPSYSFDETSISFSNSKEFALYYSSEDGNPDDWQTADQTRFGDEEIIPEDEWQEDIGHYKVYLNMVNPLVLEGDYLDERDIYEWPVWAKQEGYDGIIHRDFDGYGADIYQVFNSNQIKDTRNLDPTENPDIRFSMPPEDDSVTQLAAEASDLEEVPLNDPLLEEGRLRMAKSKKDFVNSLNSKWNERWLTEGKVLDLKSVESDIRNLVKGVMQNSDTDRQYKSDVVKAAFIDAKSAFWLLKDGKTGDAAELLWKTARSMIENVDFVNDTMFVQYKGLRDYLRKTDILVGPEYQNDIHFNEFRKRNFGRLQIRKGPTNIDNVYKELSEMWPEFFNEEEVSNPADQLYQIEDVLDKIRPYREAYSSEQAKNLAWDIAEDLLNIVYHGEEYVSVADSYKTKYEQRTKEMKARHQDAIRKIRERKDEQIRKERERFRKYKESQRESKERARRFGSIERNYTWLARRLVEPNKNEGIPEEFRKSLAELLYMFDFQTEASRRLEQKYGIASKNKFKIWELKARYEEIAKEDDTGIFIYDGNLLQIMDDLAKRIDGTSIDQLTTEDLVAVDTIMNALVHDMRQFNKIRVLGKEIEIQDIGEETINALQERVRKYGKRRTYTGSRGLLDKLVNEGEETPRYFFERIGGGLYTMFKELRKGNDQHIRNMDFIRKRFEQICGEYFNAKTPGSKMEKWRNSSEAKPFDLTYGSITLTPAQMMSLYCHSKRLQSLGHILGAGIVAAPVTTGQKLNEKFKGKAEQVDSVMVTYADIKTIIKELTEDQIKIADELQSLLNNEMAAWGNETSMKLYGYKQFREQNYFPIKVSGEVLSKDANQMQVMERIKNFGFTKGTVRGASNAIMLDDIFSVVADHCNKMSLYNAFAIPITDFMRVYNYKRTTANGGQESVQQKLGEAFTRKANSYIMKFISDVNGNTKTKADAVEDLANKALANYKKASIGFNMRVALQQPTSIFRALMVIDPKYFSYVHPYPGAMKEMFEHCPIALWKSWGHYDVDMGRDIEDIMMNKDWGIVDTFTMGAYGALDNITWTAIWQAVKAEVQDKHPDVTVGSQEFWDLCNERASEVFDKTQVVDSIFHRSETMRSKNVLTKMMTSFMAEPTLTFNVFRDSLVNAAELWKDGDQAGAAKVLFRMSVVLLLNAAAVSASAALWDVVRDKNPDSFALDMLKKLTGDDGDDDDDKEITWQEKWFNNFLANFSDNANLLNNIYFVKDIYGLKDGWGTSNMALEGFEKFWTGFNQMKKKVRGQERKGSEKTWYQIMQNMLGGVGYITGAPVYTAMRDAKFVYDLWLAKVFALTPHYKYTLSDGSTVETKPTQQQKSGEKTETINLNKYAETGGGKSSGERVDDIGVSKTMEEKTSPIGEFFSGLFNSGGKEKKESEKEEGKVIVKPSGETVLFTKDGKVKQKAFADMSDAEKIKYINSKYAKDVPKSQRADKIWDKISDGYNDYIEQGDYEYIERLRHIVQYTGGDLDAFDAKILEASKRAYKKTIIPDADASQLIAQDSIKDYMLEHGVSDNELSEICYKSLVARDLKAAFRLNNEEYIVKELAPLKRAGLSYEDFERLYKNRNYGKNTYSGKYAKEESEISTGTFKWPANGVITSGYGSRTAPTKGASSYHEAIDIGGSIGDPIQAADGGTVTYAGWFGGYGYQVRIQHKDGSETRYSHLSGYNVQPGDVVRQGDQIAKMGSTGTSTGPHLDFQVRVNGSFVNPLEYLQG